MGKMERVLEPLLPWEHDLQCPICKSGGAFQEGGSFVCEKGHCYDISSRGYIHFAPDVTPNKYGKELFLSRRALFDAGIFQPVVDTMDALIMRYCQDLERIVDAGCGEGYYSRALKNCQLVKNVFGMDLSKDAIRMAAARTKGIFWAVGDLAKIPIKNERIDLVLNILTPANYEEFGRILKPDGLLIKIVPGGSYLTEIRERLEKKKKESGEEKVKEYFAKRVDWLEEKEIRYSVPTDPDSMLHFFQMTPMTFDIPYQAERLEDIHSVTVDFSFLVGRKKK